MYSNPHTTVLNSSDDSRHTILFIVCARGIANLGTSSSHLGNGRFRRVNAEIAIGTAPMKIPGLTRLKAIKVLRDLEVPKLATCRRQRCSLHSTVSSPLIHYPNSCNLRFRLSCTSIAGNRLHKCTRSSTSLGSVQLYLSSAKLHSYSSCCARLLQQLLAST